MYGEWPENRDGERHLEHLIVIARSDCDEAIQISCASLWIASLRSR
jgi:hypothetical protein